MRNYSHKMPSSLIRLLKQVVSMFGCNVPNLVIISPSLPAARRLVSRLRHMSMGSVKGLRHACQQRSAMLLLGQFLSTPLQGFTPQFLHWESAFGLDKLTTLQLRQVSRSLVGSVCSLRERVCFRRMGRKALVMLVCCVLVPVVCGAGVATWRGLGVAVRGARTSPLTPALTALVWRISREVARAATSRRLQRVVINAASIVSAVAIPAILLGARILNTHIARQLIYVSLQRLVYITWLVQYKSMAYLISTTFSTLTPRLLPLITMIIPMMYSAARNLQPESYRHLMYISLRNYLLPAVMSVSRMSFNTLTDPATRQLVYHVVRAAVSMLVSTVTSISADVISAPATRQFMVEAIGLLVPQQLLRLSSRDVCTAVRRSWCSPRFRRASVVDGGLDAEEETVDIAEGSPGSETTQEWNPTELLQLIPFPGELSLCPRVLHELICTVMNVVNVRWQNIHNSGFLTQVAALTVGNTMQMLPPTFVGKQTLVVEFCQGLVISTLDTLTHPEMLRTLASNLQMLMSARTPSAMSSALRDLLPPPIRGLLSSSLRGVQPITDGETLLLPETRLSPALEKLFCGIVGILLWPSVQNMVVPFFQVVISPARQVALSPRAQWIFSPVKQILASPRTQMVISPARKCVRYCSERVQQRNTELKRVVGSETLLNESTRTHRPNGSVKKCIDCLAEKIQPRKCISIF